MGNGQQQGVNLDMVVSVNFYGLQRKLTHRDNIQIPLSDETRVGDVLRLVKESYPELPLSENTVLVTVNNNVSTLDSSLQDNDMISFIPHIGGG